MNAERATRRRIAAALAALAVAAGLAIYPLGGARPAAAAIDPISGFGTTDSAVTVRWADGITGADNKTIVKTRQLSGSDAFYEDLRAKYQDLTVTVSQTEGLTHQGVQVTWTGGAPTAAPPEIAGDYLQIMQCYGDTSTGPDPKACQWGVFKQSSLPQGPNSSFLQDRRLGNICQPGVKRCDPAEPSEPDHQAPGSQAGYYVPFTPVGTNLKIYTDASSDPTEPTLSTYFQAQSTNEVPVAATSADGTGQVSFEVQTGREAAGLGCGDRNTAAGGALRGCWLVIVPRGMLNPDGATQVMGVQESALGASNWAQRVQVHLSFLPTSNVCPQDAVQRSMVGTELVADLMMSWQPVLCQNSGAVYSFTPTPDVTNAIQLNSALPGSAGLAFTTEPITFPDQGPPLLYAPVAVTGLTFAFLIDARSNSSIQQVRRLSLSPQLVAKALTQSYLADLPGGLRSGTDFVQPEWIKRGTIINDPQWLQLNPDLRCDQGVCLPSVSSTQATQAPMTTADQSAVNEAVWAWIQSEPGTKAWLRGQPDAGGMVVNPNYQALNLDDPPPASAYLRADPTCTHVTSGTPLPPADACFTSVDYIPYAHSLDDAAIHVQRAFTHGTSGWDNMVMAPDGSQGWWEKAAPKALGLRFAWAITAASFSARYGLPTANLCFSDGADCVAPTAASLTAALAAAKPDSAGLLHVAPTDPGKGGYPLTQIVYAAVRTNQDPAALRDTAALLDYAAGAGQTSGAEVGQLPSGYLPLPDDLRAKTTSVAATLRELANAKPSPTAGQPGGGAPTTPGATGVPNGGATPSLSPGSSVSPGGVISQPPEALAAGSTPGDALGVIRWLLVAALVAGAAGGVGGILLRHLPTALTRPRRLRWPSRRPQ